MTTYELTSGKIQGDFTLEFDNDGCLITCKMAFKKSLTEGLNNLLFSNIPFYQKDLNKLVALGFKVSEALPANKKIALFCQFFAEYKNGQKYKATGVDGKRIKEYKVTAEILTAYFTSKNFLIVGEAGSSGRHSVINFLQNYNIVLAEMAGAGKAKYPNGWNAEFEAKLPVEQVPEYWKHLRGLGLTPKKDRIGKTIDWIKK